jgi:hypothetical protein
LAEFAADLVDALIRNIHHQHGIGAKAQRTMFDDQPHAPKQAAITPAPDLFQHRLFAGTHALGQHLIRTCGQWQAGFEQAPQLQCLEVVQE